MTYRLIRLFKLETRPEKVVGSPNGYGVMAPVGFEPLTAFLASDGLSVSGFASPNGLRVWHPIVALANDTHYHHPADRSLDFLGVVPMQTSLIHIFADLPWPTSEVEAADAQGTA